MSASLPTGYGSVIEETLKDAEIPTDRCLVVAGINTRIRSFSTGWCSKFFVIRDQLVQKVFNRVVFEIFRHSSVVIVFNQVVFEVFRHSVDG